VEAEAAEVDAAADIAAARSLDAAVRVGLPVIRLSLVTGVTVDLEVLAGAVDEVARCFGRVSIVSVHLQN